MNELLLRKLFLSLSFRRILNIIKSSFSFILSALFNKPILWGLPPVITIEPTNICNLKCPLCTTGSGEMLRKSGMMSLDTFQTVMDKLGKDIFFLLVYHQGEPYINKHFFDFIRIAKSLNIYVTTSTNGHYLSKSNVEKTILSGLDSMIISIDGINQHSYEQYRVGGKLQTVIEGTKQLLAEKKRKKSRTPNIAWQFLVMKHNEGEIPALKKLSKQIGVNRLLIKNIEVRSLHEAETWLPSNEKFRRYEYNGDSFRVKTSANKSCPRPWLSTLINWDGTIVPCCFDKNGQYQMGNIHNQDIKNEIWSNHSFQKFRQRLLINRESIDICSNCNQGFNSFLSKKLWNFNDQKNINIPVASMSKYKDKI